MTSPPLTEVWEDSFRHNNDAEEIRFNLCAEVRDGSIFYGAYVTVAGIVNEDIEATEGSNRYIDGVLCLLFVRNVERNGPHTLSKLASKIGEMLRIAGRRYYAVSGFESLFCEGSTKAAGSSRN